MTVLWVILLCLGGLLLLAAGAAAFALLWVQRHPGILVNRMRGNGEEPGNLSVPLNYEAAAARVKIVRDLEYPSGLPGYKFDLYQPDVPPSGAAPLIVWVHGGGFIAGDKAGVANLAVLLAANGYAVAAPNYAVAPEHLYPAAVRQINRFCAYLPRLAAEVPGLDISRVVLAGDSAGAQIAAQAAAVETNPALSREMDLPPRLPAGSLRGMLLCCGPYDLPGIRRAKSRKLRYLLSVWGRAYFGGGNWAGSAAAAQTVLPRQVTEGFPPTYLTDGNVNSFEVQGRRLGKALRAKGVPVRERYFPPEEGPVDHEYQFHLAKPEAQLALRDMLEFLREFVPVEDDIKKEAHQ